MSSKPAAQADLVPTTARPPECSSAVCVALPLPSKGTTSSSDVPRGWEGQVWVSSRARVEINQRILSPHIYRKRCWRGGDQSPSAV